MHTKRRAASTRPAALPRNLQAIRDELSARVASLNASIARRDAIEAAAEDMTDEATILLDDRDLLPAGLAALVP